MLICLFFSLYWIGIVSHEGAAADPPPGGSEGPGTTGAVVGVRTSPSLPSEQPSAAAVPAAAAHSWAPAIAHPPFAPPLHLLEPAQDILWDEVRPFLRPADGVPVLADSVLDKPVGRHLGLVGHHGSGGSTWSPPE